MTTLNKTDAQAYLTQQIQHAVNVIVSIHDQLMQNAKKEMYEKIDDINQQMHQEYLNAAHQICIDNPYYKNKEELIYYGIKQCVLNRINY
jgi:hypothetical protein